MSETDIPVYVAQDVNFDHKFLSETTDPFTQIDGVLKSQRLALLGDAHDCAEGRPGWTVGTPTLHWIARWSVYVSPPDA